MASLTTTEILTGFAVATLGWLAAAVGFMRNRPLLLFIARRFFGDPKAAMREEAAGGESIPLATLISQQAEALRHLNVLIESMQESLDRNAREHADLREKLGQVEGRVDSLERDCDHVKPKVAALERRVENVERAAGLIPRSTDLPPRAAR